MSLLKMISIVLLFAGSIFFLAGTIGILRFRDVHSRLHALSKADNVGLGMISLSLLFQAESLSTAVKIFVIWLIALVASALTCYVIAEWELRYGRQD